MTSVRDLNLGRTLVKIGGGLQGGMVPITLSMSHRGWLVTLGGTRLLYNKAYSLRAGKYPSQSVPYRHDATFFYHLFRSPHPTLGEWHVFLSQVTLQVTLPVLEGLTPEAKGDQTMQCPRCRATMKEEQFSAPESAEAIIIWIRGWLCRACGHTIDPLKDANHRTVESLATGQPAAYR